MIALELGVVAILIVLNGLLSMSELAVVSARRARLRALASGGNAGAAVALRLAEHPGRFLSTVQIGITLIGVLAGAAGGATLAGRLGAWLVAQGLSEGVAEALAFGGVVAAITYLSLIVGELVPKQIALRNPEGVAALVAHAMRGLAIVAYPLVFVLDASSKLLLGLMGQGGGNRQQVTEEEVKAMIAEAQAAGVVEPAETAMIAGVMRLADRKARTIMTPRQEVDWVDIDDTPDEIRARILASRHSRLLAVQGGFHNIAGVIQAKDLVDAFMKGQAFDPRAAVRHAPVIHDGMGALAVSELLRQSDIHIAVVVDEYGTFEGVVTTADVLETIAGEFGAADHSAAYAVRREDGSWLIDGAMPVDEMMEATGIAIPAGDYHTLAGFALAHLKRIPHTADSFEASGWRFEVVDMDGRRIDKLLATKPPT